MPWPCAARVRVAAGSLMALLLAVSAGFPSARQDGDAPCAGDVARQLRAWDVAGPPRPQPAREPGGRLQHWPTRTLGVWVVEETSSRRASATRVGEGRIEHVAWSAACVPARTARPRPSVPAPAFSDVDLQARLATRARGAVYVWSPHMPLSVDGYRQLEPAARARGVEVDVLLDPAANRAFAAAAQAEGLPPSALRVADAVELEFLEATMHAPSLVVYRAGRLATAVLRGYRTTAEYEQFLDRELPGPPR